ncbi:hypothetical protein Daqu01_00083 [Deinococcus aquaticus]
MPLNSTSNRCLSQVLAPLDSEVLRNPNTSEFCCDGYQPVLQQGRSVFGQHGVQKEDGQAQAQAVGDVRAQSVGVPARGTAGRAVL